MLTPKEVAHALGLKDTSLISRWETGASVPSYDNMLNLAVLYSVPMDEFSIELRKEKPLYGYIMAILQSYSDELKYQRKLFSSIEGETQEELKMLSN